MKFLAPAAALVLMATQGVAGSYQTRCETTSVPYQETVKGGQPERVIGGALVGGVLGKAITDDTGGAAVGALVGGAAGYESTRRTVTKYRDVETCRNVFIPDRITDTAALEETLVALNAGESVSKELTMDVQYTIGVAHDGKWGPKSRGAAEEYLASLETPAPAEETLYSLVVNRVVVVSSADPNAIDQIKEALAEAGVESQIFTDLE